jgi:hypothetical protein
MGAIRDFIYKTFSLSKLDRESLNQRHNKELLNLFSSVSRGSQFMEVYWINNFHYNDSILHKIRIELVNDLKLMASYEDLENAPDSDWLNAYLGINVEGKGFIILVFDPVELNEDARLLESFELGYDPKIKDLVGYRNVKRII